jgi:hypothetical protein
MAVNEAGAFRHQYVHQRFCAGEIQSWREKTVSLSRT